MKLLHIYYYFTVCLLLLAPHALLAQQYHFSRFTSQHGLSQNQTRVVMADSTGYIWAGSYEGGLSRFTGSDFKVYGQPQGLSNTFVNDMAETPGPDIWVATRSGVFRFNGKRFKQVAGSDSLPVPVYDLATGPDGNVWFYHPRKGISQITRSTVVQPFANGFLQAKTARLAFDANGRLLAATPSGLFACADGQCNELLPDSLPGSPASYTCLLVRQNGQILAGTTAGIRVLSDGNTWQTLSQGMPVLSLFEDSRQRLWAGTHAGAVCYTSTDTTYFSESSGMGGIVSAITEDFEGGIWFASFTGLYRLNNLAFNSYTIRNGLTDNLVWSIAEDDTGRLWFCTEKGVNYLENGRLHRVKAPLPGMQESPSPVVPVPGGRLVIGGNAGVFFYEHGRFYLVKKDGGRAPSEFYNSFAWQPETGLLIMGGSKGLSIFDPEARTFTSWQGLENFAGKQVNALCHDQQGRLWVATEGAGVFVLENGRPVSLAENNGFVARFVNALLCDSQGNMWLGTSGKGLYKIPEASLQQEAYNFSELEFTSENIYSLAEDGQGNIWAGTDRGISKITIVQNDYLILNNFGATEGLQAVEVCHNAIHKSASGKIWVGTVGGAVCIDPAEAATSQVPPRVRLNGIDLFFKPVDWQRSGQQPHPWEGIPASGSMAFSSDQNHLSFSFEAIAFSAPENVRFQWKLEGLDRDWSPPVAQQQAIYPGIPPGKYVLKLKAENAWGVASYQPLEYAFEVTKPFYRTRWFTAAYAVIFLGCAVFYVRGRFRNMQKYQDMLRVKVKQRTREIEQQKTKIQSQSRKLHKALQELNIKNNELVHSNEKQQQSLQYARKIQDAVMFSEEKLQTWFADAFVYLRPREVVSSDFFWTGRYGDYLFLILADCTGHGVPGAFMSILGYEYLTQIIKYRHIYQPSGILAALDKQVCATLGRSSHNLVNGLDMAICRINLRDNSLTYCGARRPLFYTSGNKMQVIKGSFHSAGITMEKASSINFTDHTIPLTRGTEFFIFSDGFPNQFNTRGEKYKIGRFKQLLQQCYGKTPQQQHEMLEREFALWARGHEQLDDILVIGFKCRALAPADNLPASTNRNITTADITPASKKNGKQQ